MLNHNVIGPNEAGRYLVVYPTPGCAISTPVCDCATRQLAEAESMRLNGEQVMREMALRDDRQLRGLGGVYSDLGE